jgi:3-oxoacyl-[acyl-carrier protein] reductase
MTGLGGTVRFKQRVAIITGSGQGIGQSIAKALAREGASLMINDINADAARKTAEEIKEVFRTEAYFVRTDVRSREDIKSLIELCMQHFGRIDILVNNAGICPLRSIEDITQEEWDEVLNINLRGVFFCSQAVTPIMKEQRRGNILNMASIAGKVGGIWAGVHYSVSKAGVICLTKAFARTLAPFGVRVNAIAPGPIDTQMTQAFPPDARANLAQTCPLGRLGDVQDIAEAALFLLSDGSKHITGEILDVNGGLLMD